MAKFIIQDIMPPERRRTRRKIDTSVEHEKKLPQDEQSTNRESNRVPNEYEQVEKKEGQSVSTYVNNEETLPEHHHDNADFDTEDDEYQARAEISHQRVDSKYEDDRFERQIKENKSRETSAYIVKGIFGVIAVLALLFVVATVFGGATVTVSPKFEKISLQTKLFSAVKMPEPGSLSYSVMQVDLTESSTAPATGQKTVTAKASGKIVVYNNYSDKTQRLIKNTRFQSPTGKIYRINESITVPGTHKEGAKIVPGSIETTVYADEPGPDYNSDVIDFTIPGLKGDARFDKIYARAKGAITGGTSGVTKSVSDEDLSRVNDDLAVTLETKLRSKIRANTTDAQIVFPQAITIEFSKSTLAQDPQDTPNTAKVERKGSIAAIVFDRKSLAQAIAKQTIPQYQNDDVTIPELEKLAYESQKVSIKELIDNEKINFTLNGSTEIRYSIDTRDIQKSLAGIEKRAFQGVMAGMQMIDKAQASIKPFWQSTFPKNPDDIKIVIKESSE